MLKHLYKLHVAIRGHNYLHLQINSIQKSSSLVNRIMLSSLKKPKYLCGTNQLQNEQLFSLSQDNFNEETGFGKIKNRMYNMLSVKTKVALGANIAYEKCADDIDMDAFFSYFKLPDTFQSFFTVLNLHVWMCSVAAASEEYGRRFRNGMVDHMWQDIELRLSHVKDLRGKAKKNSLYDMVSQFNIALVAYDEGILSDDKVLAASVWRTFFHFKDVDPRLIETLVLYIRKQVCHLESMNSEQLLFKGAVTFLPLSSIVQSIPSTEEVVNSK